MEHNHESPPAKRRRASRAGQEKRFKCNWAGCEKRYSRAEHLHRHELNHAPRQIYRCEAPDCGLTFVRADLYARHKARHEAAREFGKVATESGTGTEQDEAKDTPEDAQQSHSAVSSHITRAASSSNDDSYVAIPAQTGAQPEWNAISQQTLITHNTAASIHNEGAVTSPNVSCSTGLWSSNNETSGPPNDNFAAWLFDTPGSQDEGFNLPTGPFLDFGLEYSPKDMWHFEDFAPLTVDFEPVPEGQASGTISERRRTEIFSILGQFVRKQRGQNANQGILLMADDFFPNLTIELLDKFVANYWQNVSVQMSIVHQPTFSSNSCNLLLLLAIIALGAADLVKLRPKGSLVEYKELADTIVSHLRWEIFTDGDAEPPIQLWVAQTLLLLEFYEKQWSTRRLHERAHIHHASTLTLLRRGSPLVGRSEDETPPSEMPSRCPSPEGRENAQRKTNRFDNWWVHWVRNESFKRVVFAAFFMDTLHALMYGHAADMAPFEIRLALPCDEQLWTAESADEVHRLDSNLKMYGIRSVSFLDGLKQSLHAQHVQTHSGARMLLMSGLLSVGWHINRREKHLQFLESVPSVREQGRWRQLLLNAFGHWRTSFDEAAGVHSSVARSASQVTSAATVLFHLAHMTMHADIIDCQIFSGSTRLLGRKVDKKDYLNVVQRMKGWANSPIARHAVLHSTRLLYETLVKPAGPRKATQGDEAHYLPTAIIYSCRNDPLILRPWAVFLATLILWAYQHASSSQITSITSTSSRYFEALDDEAMCCRYLTACAAIDDLRQLSHVLSKEGCASVINVVSKDFANAEPELLLEASLRLQTCRSMLANANFFWPPR